MVGKTIHLDVTVNGRPVPGAVVDSGSERTLLSRPTADACQLKLRPSRKAVVGAGRESLPVHGAADVVLHVPGTAGEVSMEVLVAGCSDNLLLGTDFMRAAEMTMDFVSGQVTVFGQSVEPQPVTVCRCTVAETEGNLSVWEQDELVLPPCKGDPVNLCEPQLDHLSPEEQTAVKSVMTE